MIVNLESLPSFDFQEFGQYMCYHKYYDFVSFLNYEFDSNDVSDRIRELKERYDKLGPVFAVYDGHPEKHIIVTGHIPYAIAKFVYELPNEFVHFDWIGYLLQSPRPNISLFLNFKDTNPTDKLYRKRYKSLHVLGLFVATMDIQDLTIPQIADKIVALHRPLVD